MADDPDIRKRRWIMTAWSCFGALLLMSLLFVTISTTRDATSRNRTPHPSAEQTDDRMLY